MIEDVKDLTGKEKRKLMRSRHFWRTFGRCFPLMLFAIVGMTLFAIMMTERFMDAFSNAHALETTGRFLTMTLIVFALFAATYNYGEDGKFAPRNYMLVLVIVALTYITCVTTITLFNQFVIPIALVTLVLLVLTEKRVALVATVATALMILMSFIFTLQTGVDNAIDLDGIIASVICNAIGAAAIGFLVDKHLTRLGFIIGALLATLISVPLVISSTLAAGDLSINILYNVIWSYGGSVTAILVFMPIVAVLEGIFNIADDFRLNELTSLNNPLLKRLASEAPGTFNHSLVVGTLSEACAEAIGENPHMARCAAYYHDIGKLKAPMYFSENQSTYNPHDELIPEVSVSMITSHTLFGEILAKQYRLPPEIIAICREHHGTAPVGYFYRKALSLTEEGDLPSVNYTYSGPKPQTKVSAIVMIADTVEAACRSDMPETKAQFDEKIDKLVAEKLALCQFDECPITMKDISDIKATIVEVLPSIHHSRVSYDKRRMR